MSKKQKHFWCPGTIRGRKRIDRQRKFMRAFDSLITIEPPTSLPLLERAHSTCLGLGSGLASLKVFQTDHSRCQMWNCSINRQSKFRLDRPKKQNRSTKRHQLQYPIGQRIHPNKRGWQLPLME